MDCDYRILVDEKERRDRKDRETRRNDLLNATYVRGDKSALVEVDL